MNIQCYVLSVPCDLFFFLRVNQNAPLGWFGCGLSSGWNRHSCLHERSKVQEPGRVLSLVVK